jgi:hypothetical protein
MSGHGLRRTVLPILALILFALLLTSPELLHAHGANGLGLYNPDCPFLDVAARHSEASLPSVATIVATWWTVGLASVPAIGHVPSSLTRYTDPRAPPLA